MIMWCWQDGKYTRSIIGYGPTFIVVLMCWEHDQMSPIHDHDGSGCWVKVLDGKLQEVLYQYSPDTRKDTSVPKLCVSSKKHIECEQVACISGDGIHQVGNSSSDNVVVSLHVYSPP